MGSPAHSRKPRVNARADDPWMSLYEASRVLSMNRQTVLDRVVGGELVGQRIAGRTVVSRESVELMVKARSLVAHG